MNKYRPYHCNNIFMKNIIIIIIIKIIIICTIITNLQFTNAQQQTNNAVATLGKPGAPKDVILLPLSNTELDVDILPSDSIPIPGEVVGEPTRYNISYEFRIWKNKTNVQRVQIRQATGIVISFMRMKSTPDTSRATLSLASKRPREPR